MENTKQRIQFNKRDVRHPFCLDRWSPTFRSLDSTERIVGYNNKVVWGQFWALTMYRGYHHITFPLFHPYDLPTIVLL